MLTRVQLRELKAHAETTVRLGRFTALVGPNGAGKTSLLEALAAMGRVAHNADFGEVFAGQMAPAELRRQRAAGPTEILVESAEDLGVPESDRSVLGVSIGVHETTGAAHHSYLWKATGGLGARESLVSRDWPHLRPVGPEWGHVDEETGRVFEVPPGDPAVRNAPPRRILDDVADATLMRLRAESLAAPWYEPDEVPWIRPDGSGLASLVAYLLTSDQDRYRALLDAYRAVVPAVRGLRVRKKKVTRSETRVVTVDGKAFPLHEERELTGDQLLLDYDWARGVPASHASEGQLLVLGLVTAATMLDGPALLLVDDLERGLHPVAQQELVRQLHGILDAAPRLQMVVATHSPYLVDALEPEDVWALALNAGGAVAARCFGEHPDRGRAMDILETGEFWAAEGEQWVVSQK